MEQNNVDIKLMVAVVKTASRIVLENGGETYRAEEVCTRICSTFPGVVCDVFALPTGIFISVSCNGSEEHTVLKRIKSRGVNLTKLETANTISRKIASGKMGLKEAKVILDATLVDLPNKKMLDSVLCGLSAGFFSMLFGGNFADFCAAFFAGLIIKRISFLVNIQDYYNVLISIIAGIISGTIAVLSAMASTHINFDAVVIGSIMPFLPGLAMTNAIRDTMRGDLVSGTSRVAEALLIAIALAAGVGVVMSLAIYVGGVNIL